MTDTSRRRGRRGRRWDVARRIAALDPERDHVEIYRLSPGCAFPWDYRRALELALLRTFAVPSIADLLMATGEFARAPQRRYDDLARLNAVHGRRLRATADSRALGNHVLHLVASWFPAPARPAVRRLAPAVFDDELLDGLGLPGPGTARRRAAGAGRTCGPRSCRGCPHAVHPRSRTAPCASTATPTVTT